MEMDGGLIDKAKNSMTFAKLSEPPPFHVPCEHQFQPHAKMLDGENPPERICRGCHSPKLVTDWAAGDLVCTDCGVVNDESMCDTRAEWREIISENDSGKGNPALARCGLVPTDESKYVGGLEPTILSSQPFGGGHFASATTSICAGSTGFARQLVRTSRKIDRMMEKSQRVEAREADLERKLLLSKRRRKQAAISGGEGGVATSAEGQHDSGCTERIAARDGALERWALDRAVLMYGMDDETDEFAACHPMHSEASRSQLRVQEQREELSKRLDKSDRAASKDVYQAYKIVQGASLKLGLPNRVLMESTNVLCQYAARRNGFRVKGISTRSSSSRIKDDNKCTEACGETTKRDERQDKRSTAKDDIVHVRELNKVKQMSALGAALLYIVAKRLGHAVSLTTVRASFGAERSTAASSVALDKEAVRGKSFSKALDELKKEFPHLFYKPQPATRAMDGTNATSSSEAADLVGHVAQTLNLSLDAICAIRALARHCSHEDSELRAGTKTKPSTICAAATYMICLAGCTMQRLATQAIESASWDSRSQKETCPADMCGKYRMSENGTNKRKNVVSAALSFVGSRSPSGPASHKAAKKEGQLSPERADVAAFDALSSDALVDGKTTAMDHMLRGWRAWGRQESWGREIGRIENSSGVSRRAIFDFYKKHLHDRRRALLRVAHQALVENCNSDPSPSDGDLILVALETAAPLMTPPKA